MKATANIIYRKENITVEMSLQSTFDSIDGISEAASPSSSQQQQVFVTTTKVKNQHLSLAQMRGVIQIFNHYFPKKPGKRMNREEKNRRWTSYKSRIYQEYKRIITGKYASEKALVKRYSEPLAFLKYKLKRATNLNINDLSQADKEYFYEIGGLDDINQLVKNTYNIGSVAKMSNILSGQKRNREQFETGNLNASLTENLKDSNHNRHEVTTAVIQDAHVEHSQANVNQFNFPPEILASGEPKQENALSDPKLTAALLNLNEKLDVFEKEQLDKKKIEMFEITKQKLTAMKQMMLNQFLNEPHLIGCISGVEDQTCLSFDCWMNNYKHIITEDDSIRKDIDLFITQMAILRADKTEWHKFLTKWKLNRIFLNDDFHLVWSKVKTELNIQNNSIVVQHSNQRNNDKDELDSDSEII